MTLMVSIVAALVILGYLSWKDLRERTGNQGASPVAEREPAAEEHPRPQVNLTPEQISRTRHLFVNAFWISTFGNLLLGLMIPLLSGPLALLALLSLLLFAFFLYGTFRILRLLGHDPLTCGLLCLLPLAPWFALIQYVSIGARCRHLFGPLRPHAGR